MASEGAEDPKKEINSQDAVESALDRLKPLAAHLGFGAVIGYCSGMALKKVGKALATMFGLGFIAVQAATYQGYIQVDWRKVGQDSIVRPLDTSGDGKLDLEDVKLWWKKFKKMMTYQLPDATGFSMGFLCGVKYG